jgi:hypothetical protein
MLGVTVESSVSDVVIGKWSLDRSLPIFQPDIFLESSSATNVKSIVLVVPVAGD